MCKQEQLVSNILRAFKQSPKRSIPANPATTNARIAEWNGWEIFYSKVFTDINIIEHLVVSEPGLYGEEIFRVVRGRRWRVVHASPLAWQLFCREQGQQDAVAPASAV